MEPNNTVNLKLKFLALAVSFVFTGCTTLPSGSSEAPSAEFRTQALAHFSQGLLHEMNRDPVRANESFLRAIEKNPDRSELYIRTAFNQLRMQKTEEAAATMEKLVEQRPKDPESWYLKAKVHIQARQWTGAELAYLQFLSLEPSSASGQLEYIGFLMSRNREVEALGYVDQALENLENPEELLRNLSTIYLRRSVNASDPQEGSAFRTQAIEFLQMAVDSQPEDVELITRLADLQVMNEDMAGAAESFTKASALSPDADGLMKKLSLTLVATDREEEAKLALENLSVKPDPGMIEVMLGDIHALLKQPEKAKDGYRSAIELAEEPIPEAYLKLALILLNEKDPKAEEILKSGVDALPENAGMSEMLGYYYLNENRYEEAAPLFEQTQALIKETLPEDELLPPKFLLYYAIVAQFTDNTELAADLLAQAIEQDPGFLDMYLQTMFQKADDEPFDSALIVLSKAEDRVENPIQLMIIQGLIHNQNKNFEEAVTVFEKTREKHDELGASDEDLESLPSNYFFWYGAALERLGKFEDAAERFEQCIEMDPEHAEAYNYIAYMWAEQRIELDQAKLYVAKAMELVPDNGAFIDTLGWIYFMQGDYSIAENYIRKANDLVPGDPTIIEHLGDIAWKKGNLKRAEKYWKQSLEIEPDNEKLKTRMEEVLNPQPEEPLVEEATEEEALPEASESTEEVVETETPTVEIPEPIQEPAETTP